MSELKCVECGQRPAEGGPFCSPRCRDQWNRKKAELAASKIAGKELQRKLESKRIMGAICCKDSVHLGMFQTIPGGLFEEIKVDTTFPLDESRNRLVDYFIENTTLTHLCWLDYDIVFPPNFAEFLAMDGDLTAPFCWVGGMVKEKFYLPMPGLYRWNDAAKGGKAFTTWSIGQVREAINDAGNHKQAPIVETDLVGGGCYMMSRKVAEEIHDDKNQHFRLTWEDQDTGRIRHGEDIYFFEMCRRAGLKFKVHLGVELGHMKPIDMRYFGHVIYGMMPQELYDGIEGQPDA